MNRRLTIFVYDDIGSFVKLKLLTKKRLYGLGGVALVFILAFGFVLFHYGRLLSDDADTCELKREISNLRSVVVQRDSQIARFTAKIDTLQMKMIKLDRYEQKIRQIVGKEAKGEKLESYGIGGTSLADISADFLSSEQYHEMISGIDQSVESLDEATEKQTTQFKSLWKTLKALKHLEAATPSIRPVDGGWVSSEFGYRDSPFTGKREFHSGVDIACRQGTPIKATADGKILFAGVKGLLGKTVVIDHGFGIKTRYGHMRHIGVDCGQSVIKGDIIGEIGSTGRATGPHIHYEVRLNDVPVDAEKYMNQRVAQH